MRSIWHLSNHLIRFSLCLVGSYLPTYLPTYLSFLPIPSMTLFRRHSYSRPCLFPTCLPACLLTCLLTCLPAKSPSSSIYPEDLCTKKNRQPQSQHQLPPQKLWKYIQSTRSVGPSGHFPEGQQTNQKILYAQQCPSYLGTIQYNTIQYHVPVQPLIDGPSIHTL